MKKTKFLVEIHRNGSVNDCIIRMITNHNEGKVSIDLPLFGMVCKAKYAEFPTITPEFQLVSTPTVMDIYEIIGKEKKHTLTIRVVEVQEENEQTVQPEYMGDDLVASNSNSI